MVFDCTHNQIPAKTQDPKADLSKYLPLRLYDSKRKNGKEFIKSPNG